MRIIWFTIATGLLLAGCDRSRSGVLTPLETVMKNLHSDETLRSFTLPPGAPDFSNVSFLSAMNYSEEPFEKAYERTTKEKREVMARQMRLLNDRYDLSDRPSRDAKMTRGKALQEGVRVRLARDFTWD